MKQNVSIPTRQTFDVSLKRYFGYAGLSPEGVCNKMLRKTLCSWLVVTSDNRNPFVVLNSIGHDLKTSQNHYMGLPFNSEEKNNINLILMGWGE